MSVLIAASVARLYLTTADQYGIPRAELLAQAGMDAAELSDPDTLIPRAAADALLRALFKRAGDPALGLRMARAYDLRSMGFWGYALMSSLTLHQRIQLHLRYDKLQNPGSQVAFRVEGGRAITDFQMPDFAPDILPVAMDCGMAVSCIQLAKHFGCAKPDVGLWLTYAEQPHHRELRALITGPVVFDAPHFRVEFAACELDRRLPGDLHLLELAKTQLESQLARLSAAM